MCSKFKHMQRDCTCACPVACLYSHNSISNVMVSLTIHENTDIYIFIYQRSLQKHETFVEGPCLFSPNIVESVFRANRSLYLGFVFFLCLSISLSVSVCVSQSVCCVLLWCSWLWWWWREGRGGRCGGEGERLIDRTIWAKVSLKIAETEQLYR